MGWVVLVPVKRLAGAKSRLDVAPGLRRDLVLAMAADVVAAAAAVAAVDRVLLLSDEPGVQGLGHPVLPDAAVGLSASVVAAAAGYARVAVLAADLPALRDVELAAALALAGVPGRGVVADAQGGGTVLLTAQHGPDLLASYGEGSRARHVDLGAVDLTPALGAAPGLRCDVDTVADLAAAVRLGVGPATAAALGLRPATS